MGALAQLGLFFIMAVCAATLSDVPAVQAGITAGSLLLMASAVLVVRPFWKDWRNIVTSIGLCIGCLATLLNWAVAPCPLCPLHPRLDRQQALYQNRLSPLPFPNRHRLPSHRLPLLSLILRILLILLILLILRLFLH